MTHAHAVPEDELSHQREPEWGLVSYRVRDGLPSTGIAARGLIRALPGDLGSGPLLQRLQNWPQLLSELDGVDVDRLAVVEDAELDLPLRFPPKMVFAGANYHAHAAEMGTPVPDGSRPYFFLKPPSTTLVRDGDPVTIGASQSRIDWEAELAVVIGRRCRGLTPGDAMDAVAGYIVLNDITDRSRLRREPPVLGPAFAFDWLSAKALDHSCPVSRALVPASLVGDPHNLGVRLWVNDELQQDGSTSDMVADVPTLLAAISEVLTLEPGDIIATGTPAGVGVARDLFLRPGDRVVAEVEGIGRVSNEIVLAEQSPSVVGDGAEGDDDGHR